MRLFVSCIPLEDERCGTATYMRHVVYELKKLGHDLTLLVEPGRKDFFQGIRSIEAPQWSKRPLLSLFYHLFIAPTLLKSSKFDGAIILAGNQRLFARSSLPAVAVIHDLHQFHLHAREHKFLNFYYRHILPFFGRRTRKIVAVSQTTAEDLINLWHIKPKAITVNYNGLSMPGCSRSGWANEHGLTHKGYILYIAPLNHPGKNHCNLIRAYQQLPPGLISQFPLILAGANLSEAKKIRQLAENSKARKQIRFTAPVPDDCLADAYSHAAIYIFPSQTEGFGLQMIEAMHHGTACCVSSKGALGEIGGNAVELFDPENPVSITEAMRRLLIDLDRREELQQAGKQHVRKFSWRIHAEKLVTLCATE